MAKADSGSGALEFPRLVHRPGTAANPSGEKKVVADATEYDAAMASGWEAHARGYGVSAEVAAAQHAAAQVDADLAAKRKAEDTARQAQRNTEDAKIAEERKKADEQAQAKAAKDAEAEGAKKAAEAEADAKKAARK